MQPVAYLIFSNLPGENKLKNIKYFLRKGDNVVGADPRCQIVLPSQYEMLNHAVNINVGHNFLTLEALHPHLVYVQANLARFHRQSNSDNYFPLAVNVKYLPRIGQFFYIGRIKTIVGTATFTELSQMNNIVNRELFILEETAIERMELQQENVEEKFIEKTIHQDIQNVIDGLTLVEEAFDPNQGQPMDIQKKIQICRPVQGQNNNPELSERPQVLGLAAEAASEKSKTERLDQQDYIAEATLVLEDGCFANEPTINLDECPYQYHPEEKKELFEAFKPAIDFSQHKSNEEPKRSVPQPYSQQVLIAEIRKGSQPEHNEEQVDFSMPDTIVDKDPEEHPHVSPMKKQETERVFRQVESKEEGPEGDEEDEMPPTIQEAEEQVIQKIKPTKTLNQHGRRQTYPERLYRSDQVSFGNSFQEPDKDIENFDDLFGIEQKPQLPHYNSLPVAEIKASEEPSLGLMNISSVKQEANHPSDERNINKKKKSRNKNEAEEEVSLDNKVNIVGFKPTAAHRDFLKKQGYEIVFNPHDDYGLLLVKEPLRLCNRLLHALLDGKKIQNQQWIFNKASEIQSKINGLTWRQIYEKKGTHSNLLKGKGRFYLSKRLQQLLQGVIQKMGGQVVQQLADKRRVMNVVLRAEDSLDTELYLQNRETKKWRFLKSQIIVDTVLTGRYSVEQKYIIDLFKEDNC